MRRRRLSAIGLAAAAGLVLAIAISAAAQSASVTFPDGFATWTSPAGPLTIGVGCALPSGTCKGNIEVLSPDGATSLSGGDYSAPAGGAGTMTFDPPGEATQKLEKLDKVLLKVQPSMGQGDAFQQTLPVKRKTSSGGGGGGNGDGGDTPGGDGGGRACTKRCERFIRYFNGAEKQIAVFQATLWTEQSGSKACVAHKVVNLQKRFGRRWRTIARLRTGAAKANHPGFIAETGYKTVHWDHARLYRFLAPKVRAGGRTCLAVKSKQRHAGVKS